MNRMTSVKKWDVYDFMLLLARGCFFKEKHKIIDVPFYYIEKEPNKKARLNRFIVAVAKYKLID